MKTNSTAPTASTLYEIQDRVAKVEQAAKAAGQERGALVQRLHHAEARLAKARAQMATQEDPAAQAAMTDSAGEAHQFSRILRLDPSALAELRREIEMLTRVLQNLRPEVAAAASEQEAREGALATLKAEVGPHLEALAAHASQRLAVLQREAARLTDAMTAERDPDRLVQLRQQHDEAPLRALCAECDLVEAQIMRLRVTPRQDKLHLSFNQARLEDRLAELRHRKATLTTASVMRFAPSATLTLSGNG